MCRRCVCQTEPVLNFVLAVSDRSRECGAVSGTAHSGTVSIPPILVLFCHTATEKRQQGQKLATVTVTRFLRFNSTPKHTRTDSRLLYAFT